MRLIDADALKHTLCELERRAGFGTIKDSLDGFKLLIDYAPTVDAVPVMTYPQVDGITPTVVATPDKVRVVRCGECRWFDRGDASGTVEPIGYRCKHGCRFVDADDFCKYGERREE